MRDFRNGIRVGVNEHEYQSALREYRGGLVIGLKRNRRDLFSLHRAECLTISYDGPASRSGKILFRDQGELDTWLRNNSWVGKLNHGCRYC